MKLSSPEPRRSLFTHRSDDGDVLTPMDPEPITQVSIGGQVYEVKAGFIEIDETDPDRIHDIQDLIHRGWEPSKKAVKDPENAIVVPVDRKSSDSSATPVIPDTPEDKKN